MNWKTLLLGLVLIDMLAITALALWEVGYIGLFELQLTSWGGIQVLMDLVVACGLIALWMYRDARQRGINPWPYLVATLFAGSIGPLLYLLRREWRQRASTVPAGA